MFRGQSYFLAFDIMKSAPRIDAGAVDLNDRPTLKCEQCTGCPSQMDPFAAMFRNQDECGYDDAVYYQPTGSPKNNARDDAGWVPATEMFPPGVAPDPACCIGGALEGGGYATESRFLTLPDTLEPGDYTCLVRLDSPDDIGENDESNNARSALKRLTIVAP